MDRPTKDEKQVAIIWQWLTDAKAPVAVKIAFKELALKHVLDSNLKYWQPEEFYDAHAEDN